MATSIPRPATVLQHPSAPVHFDVRAVAARCVAEYKAAHAEPEFDPPTPEQFETLDTVEVLHRLCEQLGAKRVQHLLVFVAAARGEAL